MNPLAGVEPSTIEDGPPRYSTSLQSDPLLSLGKLALDGGKEFEKTGSGYGTTDRAIYSKCTRCSTQIETPAFHYGCTKCIEDYTCVCQECHETLPTCRIHLIDLIKRTFKPWHALPPWMNYIDPTPSKNDNPLIHALKSHDDNLTTFHAQGSSLLNAHTYLGYSPLHFAVHLNLVSGASILLSQGALANSREIHNQTPLLLAIDLDRPEIVSLLLQHNANIHSACGHRDTTALHAASANGGRGTALQLASRIASYECASILLDKGANPNARSEIQYGDPPIVCAVQNNNAELVDLLMKYGANIDPTHTWKEQEYTALYIAISSDFQDTARKLIAYGADVNWQSKKGITLLMRAAALGRGEMIKILIEGGADADTENSIGMNAVIFAALNGEEMTLATLFRMGATGKPPTVCKGKWKTMEKFWNAGKGRVKDDARFRILKRLRVAKYK